MNRPLKLVLLATLLLPGSARAQLGGGIPTPQQAQELLRANPSLADSLRQRLTDSRMTPDQIRARLRASGYPESLLDAYLGSATPGQGNRSPSQFELGALSALGLSSLSLGDSLPLDTGFIRMRN